MQNFFRTWILLICISGSTISFAQSDLIPRKEVLEDLQLMQEVLLSAHYDPFAYISEKEYQNAFNLVRESITKDSLSSLEVISAYQKCVSALNNGHTEIDFPAASYISYLSSGGTLFPLELAFENGKAWVRKNWSDSDKIETGDEILAINGQQMDDVLKEIYPQVSAERTYFKNAKIEFLSFPRYYWQVFGAQNDFQVTVRDNSGESFELNIAAINGIEDFEMQRNEILNTFMQLKFVDGNAYINPGSFSGDLAQYKRFVDSCFAQIQNSESENLIIDLRNNAGGDNEFSDYLVSYIADQPFRWYHSFHLRTSSALKEIVRENFDTTTLYNQQILHKTNGERYSFDFEPYEPQSEDVRFKGNVYVLVNRQSHSQAAVTAAQIQDLGFGKIVGEETGDYPTLYASQFTYVLPRTGIPLKISKGRIVRVSGDESAKGVIPDWIIQDHLLDEKDEILEALLSRLAAN